MTVVERDCSGDGYENAKRERKQRQRASSQFAHDRGPNDVIVFFDCQRPKRMIVHGHAEKARDIGQINKAQAEKCGRGLVQNAQEDQERIICWKNSQSPAGIKPAVVIGPGSGIEEDSRDQKSRENEEQVYAEGSRLSRLQDNSAYPGKGEPAIFRSKPMEEQHAENCNSAQYV